jgi:hypothetical protein
MVPKRHGFLRLVTERHDPNLTRKHICPYCRRPNTVMGGVTTQTLVGGPYNHFTTHCTCNFCHEDFIHHWREQGKHWKTGKIRRVHWYTDKSRKVLAGIPGCYEPYLWTCKHCGGDVAVKREKYDGVVTPEQAKALYWHRFTCQSCKRSARAGSSGWNLPGKPGPKPPPRKPYKGTFKVKEVVGVGFANLGAIKKLQLEAT